MSRTGLVSSRIVAPPGSVTVTMVRAELLVPAGLSPRQVWVFRRCADGVVGLNADVALDR